MAATAAAVAFSGGTATAASAPVHPADRGSAVTKGPAEHTVTSEMTTVRVTELVTRTPDHAGNVTVRLANGKTIPIPAADKDLVMRRAAQQTKAHLKDTDDVCGLGEIRLYNKSNDRPVAIRTGFALDKVEAIDFTWIVTITGPSYSHEYSPVGPHSRSDRWEGRYESEKDQDDGTYRAVIDERTNVVLSNGEVCNAFGGSATRYLSKPKAACLKWAEANSGDGWIHNSTENVDHVNKDITPKGPAGTRAAGAQACLRQKLGSGTPATKKDSVTGWLDAKDFVSKNSPATTLARCHLIARSLGGKGQDDDGGLNNLVPCWQVGMNTGPNNMWTFEKQVKDTVEDPAKVGPDDAVFYMVTPLYRDKNSTIPTGVTMSAAIQRADGTQSLLPITGVTNTEASGLNLGN
ncbi:DNA/RNA non-specific endonuclease [Streptomyces sp. NPDC002536]